MDKKRRLGLLPLAGGLAGLLVLCVGHPQAHATSSKNGTVQAPLAAVSTQAASENPSPPLGPFKSPMPISKSARLGQRSIEATALPIMGEPGVTGDDLSPTDEQSKAMTEGNKDENQYDPPISPFSSKRVAVIRRGESPDAPSTPVTSFPFRATGKLYADIKDDPRHKIVCTASLVRRGVLLTAAHCVFDYGKKDSGWNYYNFIWCPANVGNQNSVYGCYSATLPSILTPYYNGSDICDKDNPGVNCNNDIAALLVQPKSGAYPGAILGWYRYAWNGYGARTFSLLNPSDANPEHIQNQKRFLQITQLGYPANVDGGIQMERNDAVGIITAEGEKGGTLWTTLIGSALQEGASGGPWFVNFGAPPFAKEACGEKSPDNNEPCPDPVATKLLSQSTMAIVGVYSFTTGVSSYVGGASYFGQTSQYPDTYGGYGAGNIGKLMHDTCTNNPDNC